MSLVQVAEVASAGTLEGLAQIRLQVLLLEVVVAQAARAARQQTMPPPAE
jgi:hypothetical protein